MKVEQAQWTPTQGWSGDLGPEGADLVLVFGAREPLEAGAVLEELAARQPGTPLVGCSTAGEILDVAVTDGTVIASAVRFESSHVRTASARIGEAPDAEALGRRLATALPPEGIRSVMVLSEGISVNGSDLARGLRAVLPPGTLVTGGLSGDAAYFQRTVVVDGTNARDGTVVVVGFYGDRLRVGHGCLSGWDPFGPERLVTRAEGNVLHELDGRSALALYKKYLGEHARELPSSALMFPLSIRTEGREGSLVRTILAVDEERQTMTFAGDIPEGSWARLMKANFERLIDGAEGAARYAFDTLDGTPAELAILISCVGRKLVLDQRIEEEVEVVRDVLGARAALTGFYSYGEISPLLEPGGCELHNQTMTITTFAEV
ncbi:MAG: FIST C-terminal domain-containing protein [Gemmatimonadota bacterium]|nr:FIST C-terminal domain-containing protein [Gemmatimonadota bacterium]